MQPQSPSKVTRRRVFYFPGYDPFHPRRYRELYRRESSEQARVSGYDIALSHRPNATFFGWQVAARMGGIDTITDVSVLVWSDIVRGSMRSSVFATYLQLLQTAWTYLSTGALWRLMRLRKGPVIAALYPVCMLVGQLALALVLALGVYAGTGRLLDGVMQAVTVERPGDIGWSAKQLVAAALGGAAGLWLMSWFKRQDGRFFAYYLMHDFAFSAGLRGAMPPELEQRLRAFGDAIADALSDDVEEVLVVGHSSGAHLAAVVLADLLREGRVSPQGPTLSFLSLGHVVPMVSFLPDAHRLRGALQYLSCQDAMFWVDVTAPGDGCAFALCDPVAVSGVAPEGKRWPLVFSAAFSQSLSPARWKALRWRFFRLHFQYLCAFDAPKDYDYFQITAGPLTLGARYANRAPSKSRIVWPVSKYTSVSA
jgi:hypothetical protein